MRYFLHMAYDGTNYKGWQRQTNAVGIQQIIEEAISKMLKERVFIQGCGRTDSGVHALQYFAHIDFNSKIDFDFVERINLMLPDDISIYELIPVNSNHHAQYDAKYRTYTYLMHTRKIPSKSSISAYYNLKSIDLNKICVAIQFLKQNEDFRSLCKNPDLYKHTICRIEKFDFIELSENVYKFEIKADRFLRGMIRYIIARLLDIGTSKLSLDEFKSTISAKKEFNYKFHKKGHPQGLYLSKVEYPYLTRKVIS